MRNGVRLGKLLGIEIFLDHSWFFIPLLIAWSFANLFAEITPELGRASHLGMGLLGAVLFFASVVGHELSHAVVARGKGVPVHSITLFVFGGVARIRREPRTPGDDFQIAGVGPLTSVILGGLFLGIGLVSEAVGLRAAAAVFSVLGQVNLALAAFNMLPGFPLDGGRVLRSIVWRVGGSQLRATRVASVAGQGVAALLIAYGLYRIFTSQFFGGVWMILIGLFLNQAASGGYRQLLLRSSLEGLTVADLMTADPAWIPGNTRLDEAVEGYFLARRHSAFPVVGYGDRVEGLVTLQLVRDTPRESWPLQTVRQVMVPLRPAISASPEESIEKVLDRMEQNPVGRFVVVEGERLVGILGSSDIVRRLRAQVSLGEQRS